MTTAALPTSKGTKSTAHKWVDTPSTKQQCQQEHASQWCENQHHHIKLMKHRREDDDETSSQENGQGKSSKPSFLNVAEKKCVAFIRHEFHQEFDTVNAYIVFAHASPRSPLCPSCGPHPTQYVCAAHSLCCPHADLCPTLLPLSCSHVLHSHLTSTYPHAPWLHLLN